MALTFCRGIIANLQQRAAAKCLCCWKYAPRLSTFLEVCVNTDDMLLCYFLCLRICYFGDDLSLWIIIALSRIICYNKCFFPSCINLKIVSLKKITFNEIFIHKIFTSKLWKYERSVTCVKFFLRRENKRSFSRF